MLSHTIRSAFLDFFQKEHHKIVPSGSLVPKGDDTLLFTSAGMVPFKSFFTQVQKAPAPTLASCQKCLRSGGKHNDLEQVGYTPRHHTFFEMLGNFSFGKYFKEEAIYYAWTFLTRILSIPAERLYVTVYHTDHEAADLWRRIGSLPPERILPIATSDNFWSAGDTGPCGPCTEIFYDHGPHLQGGLPGSTHEGDRYVELWNLVFMQFDAQEDGAHLPLAQPCIDTGSGLERLAAVMQGVHDNFETDILRALVCASYDACGLPYIGPTSNHDAKICASHGMSHRIIADHIRAICFLIADGVMPENEGRGYVLRRILRRALRHVHTIKGPRGHLMKMVDPLVQLMGSTYGELVRAKPLMLQLLQEEEERFAHLLQRGLGVIHQWLKEGSCGVLPGEKAFQLYDTYGFPLDLTQDVLREHGRLVDEEGFLRHMAQQQENSRRAHLMRQEGAQGASWKKVLEEYAYPHTTAEGAAAQKPQDGSDLKSHFVGYDTLEVSAHITYLMTHNAPCGFSHDAMPKKNTQGTPTSHENDGGNMRPTQSTPSMAQEKMKTSEDTACHEGVCAAQDLQAAKTNAHTHPSSWTCEAPLVPPPHTPWAYIITNATPFYPQGGGQVGDTGWIYGDHHSAFRVVDTQRHKNTIVHKGFMVCGTLGYGQEVRLCVDAQRRQDIAANHSATHLLQGALKSLLGAHVGQRGSWVGPDKLRFDVNHRGPIDPQILEQVERLVNKCIMDNSPSAISHMPYAEAMEQGITCLLGETYEETVRIVRMHDLSRELCGGTHVASTGHIGLFKITQESALASGIRRIEAVTRMCAIEHMQKQARTLGDLARQWRCTEENLESTLSALKQQKKQDTPQETAYPSSYITLQTYALSVSPTEHEKESIHEERQRCTKSPRLAEYHGQTASVVSQDHPSHLHDAQQTRALPQGKCSLSHTGKQNPCSQNIHHPENSPTHQNDARLSGREDEMCGILHQDHETAKHVTQTIAHEANDTQQKVMPLDATAQHAHDKQKLQEVVKSPQIITGEQQETLSENKRNQSHEVAKGPSLSLHPKGGTLHFAQLNLPPHVPYDNKRLLTTLRQLASTSAPQDMWALWAPQPHETHDTQGSTAQQTHTHPPSSQKGMLMLYTASTHPRWAAHNVLRGLLRHCQGKGGGNATLAQGHIHWPEERCLVEALQSQMCAQ